MYSVNLAANRPWIKSLRDGSLDTPWTAEKQEAASELVQRSRQRQCCSSEGQHQLTTFTGAAEHAQVGNPVRQRQSSASSHSIRPNPTAGRRRDEFRKRVVPCSCNYRLGVEQLTYHEGCKIHNTLRERQEFLNLVDDGEVYQAAQYEAAQEAKAQENKHHVKQPQCEASQEAQARVNKHVKKRDKMHAQTVNSHFHSETSRTSSCGSSRQGSCSYNERDRSSPDAEHHSGRRSRKITEKENAGGKCACGCNHGNLRADHASDSSVIERERAVRRHHRGRGKSVSNCHEKWEDFSERSMEEGMDACRVAASAASAAAATVQQASEWCESSSGSGSSVGYCHPAPKVKAAKTRKTKTKSKHQASLGEVDSRGGGLCCDMSGSNSEADELLSDLAAYGESDGMGGAVAAWYRQYNGIREKQHARLFKTDADSSSHSHAQKRSAKAKATQFSKTDGHAGARGASCCDACGDGEQLRRQAWTRTGKSKNKQGDKSSKPTSKHRIRTPSTHKEENFDVEEV